MYDIAAQAEFLSAGRYTRRYNGWRVLSIDYVGMHQCNVTNIALLLRPDCRKELVVACVCHDSPEWASKLGDIPSPIKHRVPGLKEAADAEEARVWAEVGLIDPCEGLTPEEYRIMKIADYLDGMMFCIQERRMGNTFMHEPMQNFTTYVYNLIMDDPLLGVSRPETTLFLALQEKWVRAGGTYDSE